MSEPTPSHPQQGAPQPPRPLWRRLLAAHVARVDRWHARAEELGEIAVEGGAASLETGARLWRESLGAGQALGRAWWGLGRKLMR